MNTVMVPVPGFLLVSKDHFPHFFETSFSILEMIFTHKRFVYLFLDSQRFSDIWNLSGSGNKMCLLAYE